MIEESADKGIYLFGGHIGNLKLLYTNKCILENQLTWDEGMHNLTIKYNLFKKDAVENTEKKIASL